MVTKLNLISNTSPLLYLGRLQQVLLLADLFETIKVPRQVALELDAGRLLRTDTIDPCSFDWITMVTITQEGIEKLPNNRLGIGEQSAIAYARNQPDCILALDDRQARLLANQLNIPVIGTLGILIKAKRANLILKIKPLLDTLQKQGFRMDKRLYSTVLKLAKE